MTHDANQLSWKINSETRETDVTIKKLDVIHHPQKLVDTIDLGDYTLQIFGAEETISNPLYLNGKVCSYN